VAMGIAGLTWLTAAATFTIAEDVGVNGRVHSFGDALCGRRAQSRRSVTATSIR
jgi:hypothetical protein